MEAGALASVAIVGIARPTTTYSSLAELAAVLRRCPACPSESRHWRTSERCKWTVLDWQLNKCVSNSSVLMKRKIKASLARPCKNGPSRHAS